MKSSAPMRNRSIPSKLSYSKDENPLVELADKINETISFIEYFIRETKPCCSCNGKCARHPNFIATRSGDEPITVNRYDKNWRKGYVDEIYDEPEQTLAQKFQAFREKRGNGSGADYWEGLEKIASLHFSEQNSGFYIGNKKKGDAPEVPGYSRPFPQSEVKPNVGMLRQWLNEDRITDPKKMVTNEDLEYWLKVAESSGTNGANPQSEKCCEKCNYIFSREDRRVLKDEGILPPRTRCKSRDCPCHKESPVSQSVEWNSNTFPNREDITRNLGAVSQTVDGWEESGIGDSALNHLADIIIDDTSDRTNRIRKIKNAVNKIILKTRGEALSTLVKKMEGLKKGTFTGIQHVPLTTGEAGFNAGISAAVEVVKKTGI